MLNLMNVAPFFMRAVFQAKDNCSDVALELARGRLDKLLLPEINGSGSGQLHSLLELRIFLDPLENRILAAADPPGKAGYRVPFSKAPDNLLTVRFLVGGRTADH